MTVAVVAGTTAEIIKLSPVIRALEDAGSAPLLWNTAQHVDGLRQVLDELGLRPADEHFIAPSRQRPLVAVAQVPGWVVRVLAHGVRHRSRLRAELRADGLRPTVMVHGDTFTTVLGTLLGKFLSADVVHVEAGMRSGRLMHPFPEEINRRLVAQLADVHFAPTQTQVDNLRRERVRGDVVDTGANTAIDALRARTVRDNDPFGVPLPEVFGLVTLHRFELLRNDELLEETLRLLRSASEEVPLLMPAGDTERQRIEALGLHPLFDDRFQLLPKYSYPRFVPLLRQASFVVTDSGGLQQECGVLGLPCAVHREATESHEGLGRNVVLTRWDLPRLSQFLREWQTLSQPSRIEDFHPTEVVLEHLRRTGRAQTRA